jgi:hypothetical protein
MSIKITKKTTLKEILKGKKGEEVLVKYGVPCLSCPMASLEIDKLEIGQVCAMYDLPLEKILKDLNK